MTFRIKGARHRRKVRFVNKTMKSSTRHTDSSASPTRLEPAAQGQAEFIIEELSGDDFDKGNLEEGLSEPMPTMRSTSAATLIPDLYSTFPLVRDLLTTETSLAQDKTIQECLPYLKGESGEFIAYNKYGVPHLDRDRHVRFLHKSLQDLPSRFVALDAARPWVFYWALCGLRTLGEDVSPYRERLVSTVQPMQNATGGFGSGHGQMSHLAATYAVVLSLALVGGEALDIVDRKAMWRWLGAMKQRDGGFRMFIGGEEDVR